MSLIVSLQRDRRYQGTAALIFLVFVYLLFFSSSGNGFTNEEVNSLLSGEDGASDIQRHKIETLSLKTPYIKEGLKPENWDVAGDTLIRNHEYIRLTKETEDQHGLLFNKNKFDDNGFEVEFSFRIHGKAKSNQLKADGMALFLTEQPLELGPVFGAKDRFKGVGVFFDTYKNAKKGPIFPYISVMNGDGYTNYDKDNDGKANELGGCTARNIYNPKSGKVTARLIHTVEDGYLSLDYNANGNWVNCFSIKDVRIPKERYLGFSAATGQIVENVDILDVNVYQLRQFGETITSWRDFIEHIDEPESPQIDQRADSKTNRAKQRNERQRARLRAKVRNRELRQKAFKEKEKEQNEGPSFLRILWNLVKFTLLSLTILLVAYVAFTFYRVKKRASRRRKTTGLLD